MDYYLKLIEDCKSVLQTNNFGSYTVPSKDLYPHQWFWDSCFIAIGLAHIDIDRAKQEINSLFEGQWDNGMLPNMIFRTKESSNLDREFWASWKNPNSPSIPTSGITQAPIIAEAIVKIGDQLDKTEKLAWYKHCLPKLIKFHQWIYAERDPSKSGLAIIIHPWESGLDNSPPLMKVLNQNYTPQWVKVLNITKIDKILDSFRPDLKKIPLNQRPSISDVLTLYSLKRKIKKYVYNIDKIISKKIYAIEDLTFNSILVRSNQHIIDMAKYTGRKLPEELLANFENTQKSLMELWDPYKAQFFSRDYFTKELIKEPSIASLMPLYAEISDKDKIKDIVASLENKNLYASNFPVPSVPLNSKWFSETEYWQGPTWINTNWLIIDGLARAGHDDIADALRENTLDMVDNGGIFEYYNPKNGHGDGTEKFSWTAALCLDMIYGKK